MRPLKKIKYILDELAYIMSNLSFLLGDFLYWLFSNEDGRIPPATVALDLALIVVWAALIIVNAAKL